MKRKMRNSIAVALSLLLALMTFVPTTRAQLRPNRFRGSTGVITLPVGQVLRITISSEGFEAGFRAQFAWANYMSSGCNNGVCLHTVQSQGTTTPVNVASNEAASFEVPGNGNGVRVEVRANTRAVVAAASIVNTATGEVTSHVIMANTEGDFH